MEVKPMLFLKGDFVQKLISTTLRKLIPAAGISFLQSPHKACDHRGEWRNVNKLLNWKFHPQAMQRKLAFLCSSQQGGQHSFLVMLPSTGLEDPMVCVKYEVRACLAGKQMKEHWYDSWMAARPDWTTDTSSPRSH